MRSTWTDSRLDDLAKRVEEGFARVDAEFREVRAEIRDARGEVAAVRADIAAFQRTVIQIAWGAAGAILVGFAGVIAALLAS